MQSTASVLMSSRQDRPQLTGITALRLAEVAYAETRDADAVRLINIAHEFFNAQLPANYQPIDWIEDADDKISE